MTTLINTCSYSPATGHPHTPLSPERVHLLTTDPLDIRQRVRNVIQKHLAYQGSEVFEVTLTKTQITFTLQNNRAESRTLKYENNKWVLQTGTGTSADVPEQQGIEADIDHILTRIRDASSHSLNTTDASSPAASAPLAPSSAPAASAPDLNDIRARLTALEALLRSPPSNQAEMESKMAILYQSMAQLGRLLTEARNPSPAAQELRSQFEELKKQSAAHAQAARDAAAQQEQNLRQLTVTKEKLQHQIAELESRAKANEQAHTERLKLEQEKANDARQLDEQMRALADLRKKLDAALRAAEQKASLANDLQRQLETHASARSELERSLKKAQEEATAQHASLAASQTENAKLRGTNAQLAQHVQTQTGLSQEQLKKIEADLREHQSTLENEQQKARQLETKLQEQTAAIAASEVAKKKLEERFTQEIQKNERAVRELDEARLQIEKQKEELNAQLEKLRDLTAQQTAALLVERKAAEQAFIASPQWIEAQLKQLQNNNGH